MSPPSGLHLRLAFSVAAHLEPELLLVDEELAVGDAAFHQKCLAKMDSVGAERAARRDGAMARAPTRRPC